MENKFIKQSAEELLERLGQKDENKENEIISLVNKHSLIAAGAGWVPFPFLDIALVVGNVWTTYAAINKVLGISFSQNLMKSIGSGIVANLSGSILSQALLSLLKLIPGLGTISASLMLTAANYAICSTSGYVYLRALSAIAKEDGKIDPNEPGFKKKFRRHANDLKEEAKRVKDESQKDYIVEKKNEDKDKDK